MAITVTHPKVSAIPDDPASVAAGEVVPSDWNANHTVVVDGLDNVPIGAGGASTGTFTTLKAQQFEVDGPASGSAFYNSILIDPTVQSSVTSSFRGVLSRPITEATTFTLANLIHFYANPQTKGAGSTITNQYGFHAEATLTDATANYGFYGNIASAAGRFNFYAGGTAPNYFAGNTTCNTNLTVNGTTNLSALTASTALALDSSKNIVSVTNTGSGNNVLATSPTLITPSASSMGLNGSSSGTVTLNTAADAGTWTLTFPTSAGTNGYVLSTDGAGVTSWVAQSGGGGGVTSFSAGTTGLTPNTATTGAVTLAGTLAVANGGTGVTTSTGTGSVVLSNSPALGSIGIGTSAGAAIGAVIGGTLSGSSSGASIQAQPTIGSGITGEYTTYKSRPITQAATFTLANMVHFYAQPQAKGAGSTITAQYGFLADSGMTDATITYGFYSGIASGTNRFGVYMAGTAVNYFGGLVRIGSSSTGDQQLNVNGAVRVGGAITSANQTSAGTMDFNTASGQMRFLSWGASGTQGIFTWWTGAGAGGTTQRMTLNGSNNLGLATSTFGTSATNTFSVFTGTAPTTGVADTVQFYSSDLSAGNTIPSFYTEGTNVGTGTPAANRTIAVRFNGTIYYLLASTIP
jgi:hypothetical protein